MGEIPASFMTSSNRSHGDGQFQRSQLKKIGKNVIIEAGVLIFHPENVSIGDNVYIGHNSIIKGYYKNELIIGDNTWIGQQCFFHSAGGIRIGNNVGIGPCVKILTSSHEVDSGSQVIIENKVTVREVVIADGSDVGVAAILLPGAKIGPGCQIGAGAVVTKEFGEFEIITGIPAKFVRKRIELNGE